MQMFLSRDLDPDSEILTGLAAITETPEAIEDREFFARLQAIVEDIDLPEQYTIVIDRDKRYAQGRFYIQIEATRPDTYTGEVGKGRGGKSYLSPYATDSELVQAVFGLYNAYLHHEARETFLWRGRRVFGPHVDILAHWEIAERYDARPSQPDPDVPA